MNKGVTSRGSIIGSRGVSLGGGGVGSVLKDLWNIGDVHNTSQHCFINTSPYNLPERSIFSATDAEKNEGVIWNITVLHHNFFCV